MSTSDVLAVIAATLVTILLIALAVVLVSLTRTLRELRFTVDAFREDAVALFDATSDAVHDATSEVERIERLLTSADRLDDAKRAIATPLVKAMAFGTGMSRAAQRLREGETPSRRRRDRGTSSS